MADNENETQVELDVLPMTGIVRLVQLAKWTKVTLPTLVSTLQKNNVPVIKLSSYRTAWLVRLEDLPAIKLSPPASSNGNKNKKMRGDKA